MHWHKVYRFPVNSIRIFNAYGPRSRTTGTYGAAIGVFMKQYLAGNPFTIVGDGNQRRDFLYVSDVAEAFYKASITNKSGKIWNLGSSKPETVNRLCSLISKKNKKIFIPKRPGEPDITYANIQKIKEDLGWKPKVNFKEGVLSILSNKYYWKKAPLWTKKKINNATRIWFKFLNTNEKKY